MNKVFFRIVTVMLILQAIYFCLIFARFITNIFDFYVENYFFIFLILATFLFLIGPAICFFIISRKDQYTNLENSALIVVSVGYFLGLLPFIFLIYSGMSLKEFFNPFFASEGAIFVIYLWAFLTFVASIVAYILLIINYFLNKKKTL